MCAHRAEEIFMKREEKNVLITGIFAFSWEAFGSDVISGGQVGNQFCKLLEDDRTPKIT